MADSRIRLPSSEGGIVRYGDEDEGSRVKLKPEYVIAVCAAVAVLIIAIQVLKLV